MLLCLTSIISSCSLDIEKTLFKKNTNKETKTLSVFFEANSYNVPDIYIKRIEEFAMFIANNSHLKVRIIGNTDDKGSSEYNIALGQRRANVIYRIIKILGANEEQIEIISLGKEKPIYNDLIQDKNELAKNRRVDIICSRT
ncbi:peptidoglycan-associated lipoprotein [Candidatus Kinetoplastibacterium desouzaii TCC079E]|uniref:Peptidoglycan-associated lipoprotein n=2 Tax=Candidatus Kinetoplastidibacterium desouzai TaxID=994692 RepID=M1LN43_9PROT|nr:peptidoglycan-associated lipoprotein [Candidatus Kinetoplastibacterium desouzaii TCC079E]